MIVGSSPVTLPGKYPAVKSVQRGLINLSQTYKTVQVNIGSIITTRAFINVSSLGEVRARILNNTTLEFYVQDITANAA